MTIEDKHYPNITWSQFAVCNDDATTNFESLTRRLFQREFVDEGTTLHSDSNHPGIEVAPVIEKKREGCAKRRKISFQSKYFENRVGYTQIKNSSQKAIKYYKGNLDVIYLFCNQTINTTSKSFKAIEKLLQYAGIEICPISNTELLDMVAKHKDIANYFFLERKGPDDLSLSQVYAGIVVHDKGDTSFVQDGVKPVNMDLRLLESLVREKIETCRTYIMEINLAKLKEELQNIFAYDLDGVKGAEILYFYKTLSALHDGGSVDEYIEKISDEFKSDVEWVRNYFSNPEPIKSYSFGKHCTEAQVIVIDKMFSAQLWEPLYSLCEDIFLDVPSEIADTIKLYFGLTAFNLQKYEEAFDLLNSLYQKTHIDKYLLYATFAEIKMINAAWRIEGIENSERLIELIAVLDSLKENEQYVGNRMLVELIYLETAYNVGLNNKEYLECAIADYEACEDSVKNEETVRFFYGLCLELNGDTDKAVDVYKALNWNTEESVAIRYMICKISTGNYKEAIEIFENTIEGIRNAKLISLYFTSLYHINRELYQQKIVDYIESCNDNFQDLISIAFGIENPNLIKDCIFPKWDSMINQASITSLSLQEKTELISVLVVGRALNQLQLVLSFIPDMSKINRFVLHSIYKLLFEVCDDKFIGHERALKKTNQLDYAEKIADRFLEQNILRKEFLQIKYLCARAKEKRFSVLKYAKELYEISHEEGMACNIIAMLFERDETNQNAYMPYIDTLRQSEEPMYCMAVASAMLRLGKVAEADFYAYKALYFLDGKDDFEIYKNYFCFYNQNLNRYHFEGNINSVTGNTVVTLEENLPTDKKNAKKIEACLDSESEFDDPNNRSLGVYHICKNMPFYTKLHGSGLNQILKIDGVSYKIIQIETRMSRAARYIFRKISEYPEEFEGVVWVVSTDKPEDLIKQLKELTDRSEHIDTLLNLYHFKENDIGLPIDSFAGGDYDSYVDVLNWLLRAKDQALYAGFPVYEDEGNQCYVPSLSTLVLLSSMNLLGTLDAIKDLLLIPVSYNTFFGERYSGAKARGSASVGKLVTAGEKFTIVPYDTTNEEIWERIIDFCAECHQYSINDDDRIGCTIGEGINGEEFISATRLHMIHLDAFILCEKENATFLCDDLFFRKLASYAKIRNINFSSILQHYVDKDFVTPIVMELSKTNYLYVPLIARTDEEASELRKNLLDGKLKQKYNGELIERYRVAWQKVLKELFGTIPEETTPETEEVNG